MASGAKSRYRRQGGKFSMLRRGGGEQGVSQIPQLTYEEYNLRVHGSTVAPQLAPIEPFDCDCGRRLLVRLKRHQNEREKSQRSRKYLSVASDRSMRKKLFCSKDGCGCLCNADNKIQGSCCNSPISNSSMSQNSYRSGKFERKNRLVASSGSSAASRDTSRNSRQSGLYYCNNSQVSNTGSSVVSRGTSCDLSQSGKSFCEDNSVASRRSSRKLNRTRKPLRKDSSVASSGSLATNRSSSRSRSENSFRENNSSSIARTASSTQLTRRRFGTQAQQNVQRSQSNSSVASLERAWLTANRKFEDGAALEHLQSKLQNKASKGGKRERLMNFSAGERVQKQAIQSPIQNHFTRSQGKVNQSPGYTRSVHVERQNRSRTPRSVTSQIRCPVLRCAQASTRSQDLSRSQASTRSQDLSRSQSSSTRSQASSTRSQASSTRSQASSTRSQTSSTRNEKRNLSKLTKKYFNLLPPSRSASQSESRSLKKTHRSSNSGPICNTCRAKSQKLKEEKKQLCSCCHQLKPLRDFEQSGSNFLPDLSGTAQTLKNVPRGVLNNLSQVANSAVERLRSLSRSGSSGSEEKSQRDQGSWYSVSNFLPTVNDKVKSKTRGKTKDEDDLPSLRLKSPSLVNKKSKGRLQKL